MREKGGSKIQPSPAEKRKNECLGGGGALAWQKERQSPRVKEKEGRKIPGTLGGNKDLTR